MLREFLIATGIAVGIVVVLVVVLGAMNRSDGPDAYFDATAIGGPLGDAEIVVRNTSEHSATPDCDVYAYDVFGNQIGDGDYLLDPIPGGGSVTRSVKVQVDEAVTSYSAACAEA